MIGTPGARAGLDGPRRTEVGLGMRVAAAYERGRRPGGGALWLGVLRIVLGVMAAHRAAAEASAAHTFGPLDVAGSLQSQTIVRHPDVDEFHLVQQRNTVRVRARWSLVRDGKLFGRFAAGGLETVDLRLLYRGAYDSIYDATPTFRERDLRGRKPSRIAERDLGDLSRGALDAIKFESQLREAFADVSFRTLPLRFRIGKQQIVWGEADLFRMLDRANPLDTSWHFVEEIPPPAFGWDDLRIPLWMVLAHSDVGSFGPLGNVTADAYWNVGDWRPMKIAFLPRPWGIRMLNPLTNREDGAFHAPFAGMERLARSSLFKQGDYRRNPLENSQFGVRLGATFPGDLRVALYYFHQRWAGDDGSPTAPVRGLPDDPAGRVETARLIGRGTLPVEYRAPYIHTVGVSASYFVESLQTVLRLESVYDFGLPVFDRSRTTTFSPFLPGTIRRDYWKGMLAFDRAVNFAAVNDESAVFFTGQWFLQHLMRNKDTLTGPFDLPTAGVRPRPFCGAGPTEPCTDPAGNGSFRDDIRSWEQLVTLAAYTSYRNGTLSPMAGLVWDPVNSHNMNVFWNVNFITSLGLVVDVSQRFFVVPDSDVQQGPFTPWGIGTMRGRSETALRITYEF